VGVAKSFLNKEDGCPSGPVGALHFLDKRRLEIVCKRSRKVSVGVAKSFLDKEDLTLGKVVIPKPGVGVAKSFLDK